MKQWLIVSTKNNVVIGSQRSPKNELPVASTGTRQVERTEIQMAEYQALRDQAASEKRAPVITESAGILILGADDRLFLDVTMDIIDPIVDVDTPVLTFKKLLPNGAVDTAFNRVQKVLIGERLFKLAFTIGVATHGIVFRSSGTIVMDSTPALKLKEALIFDVVE